MTYCTTPTQKNSTPAANDLELVSYRQCLSSSLEFYLLAQSPSPEAAPSPSVGNPPHDQRSYFRRRNTITNPRIPLMTSTIAPPTRAIPISPSAIEK